VYLLCLTPVNLDFRLILEQKFYEIGYYVPFFEYPDIEINQGWINQMCLQIIFLHPGNPAEELYFTQLKQIFHLFG